MKGRKWITVVFLIFLGFKKIVLAGQDSQISQVSHLMEGEIFRVGQTHYLSVSPWTSFPRYKIHWKDSENAKRILFKTRNHFAETIPAWIAYQKIESQKGEWVLIGAELRPSPQQINLRSQVLLDLMND